MKSKQVILITGASSGMGKHAALKLIKEGHIVYGAARRVEKMQDLTEAGGHALKLDIINEADCRAVVDQIIAEQGHIDVLVNNAGYAIYGAIEDTSIEDARRQFDVNIFGLAQLTKMVLPHMRQQRSGKIINMSSMGGKMYTPLGAWYHATKHALEGWSDCLRLEVKQFGIDVVIIEPGGINTEFGEVMLEPLLKRSSEGPYANMTETIVRSVNDMYQNQKGSDPSVITNFIVKAIHSRKPKTRYRGGYMAKPAVFIRTFLGDKAWDRAVMSQIK